MALEGDPWESLALLVHYKWPFVLRVGDSGKTITTLDRDNGSLIAIASPSPPPQPLIFLLIVK